MADQFIKIDNDKITRKSEGIDFLAEVGLYELISAFLGNPAFETCQGGLVHALRHHCSNGYTSFHRNWKNLMAVGYLKRVQIPMGKHNKFQSYYELLDKPDLNVEPFRNFSCAEGAAYLRTRSDFVVPKENYTPISYRMLMDDRLSLGAKGLYALIRRLLRIAAAMPEVVVSKKALRACCREGAKAFQRLWNELRQAGYLEVRRVYDHTSKQIAYLYALNYAPSANAGVPSEPSAAMRPPQTELTPQAEIRRNPVVPALSDAPAEDKPQICTEDNAELLRQKIKTRISYDWLCATCGNEPLLNAVVSVMTDTLLLRNTALTIRNEKMQTEQVKQLLRTIEPEDIRVMLEALTADMKKHPAKTFRYPKQYLLRCLLNARFHHDFKVGQWIAQDF